MRSSVLTVIALCFLASAMLRGGIVAEAATSAESAKPAPAVDVAAETKAALTAEHPKDPQECDANGLIARLKTREAEFERRESALNARSAKLDVIATRVEERIAALETARKSLEKTVAMVDGAQARDIDRLVTMYSTMKPKRAGELFNQMDVRFASELLVRIKPEIAALILANMESEKAFTSSLMIARRNKNAPTK